MGRGGREKDKDFEGTTNAMRAAWAEAALDAYAKLVYDGKRVGELHEDDREMCLTDLITDLIHYSRREDFDFEQALSRAFAHAAAEAVFLWDEPTA